MSQYDIVLFQKDASGRWAEVIIAPDANGFLGFSSGKVVISKLSSVAAHASTHLPGATDPLSWTTIHGYGVLADRPAAGSTNAGLLYFATNSNGGTLFRSDGATWSALTAGLSSSAAPNDAKYILQTADGDLANAQALGALATGLLKNITTTGVLVIATANSDYLAIPIVSNSTPTTGQTVQVGSTKTDEILNIEPAGTLANLSISFPLVANSRIGQRIPIFISQIITTLTMSTLSSGTITGDPMDTSATDSSAEYICTSVTGSGVWKRLS